MLQFAPVDAWWSTSRKSPPLSAPRLANQTSTINTSCDFYPLLPDDAAWRCKVRSCESPTQISLEGKCVWINYLWCSRRQLFRKSVWLTASESDLNAFCLAVCRFSFKLSAKCLVSSSRVSLCEGGCAELSRMFIPKSIYLIGCLFQREKTLSTSQLMWWITSCLPESFIEYDTRLIN